MENRRVLNIYELMDYLGIGRNRAYELMHSAGFPSIRISPRRIVVPLGALERWMEGQAEQKEAHS